MPDDATRFLKLTFEGGRFAKHSAPVEVLVELATVQKLIDKIARHLYRERNDRQRVPPKFGEASKLYVKASVDNCFSFELDRGVLEDPKHDWNAERVFDDARDMAISALAAAGSGAPISTELPSDALELIAAMGKKLRADEWLVVGAPGTSKAAKLNKESRELIAQALHRPLVGEGEFEGEVASVSDTTNRAVLKDRSGEQLEWEYEPELRDFMVEAMRTRPITRLRLEGTFVYSRPVMRVETLEDFDIRENERVTDIEAIWERLEKLDALRDGWLEGEGRAPSLSAVSLARHSLARLLSENESVPAPAIFPTPDGGIQAEWILGVWAADVTFSPDGRWVTAEATNSKTRRDEEAQFSSAEVNRDDASPLANWLLSLQ